MSKRADNAARHAAMRCVSCGAPAQVWKTSECRACYWRRREAKPRFYIGGPCVTPAASYGTAHARVRYWRGAAALYLCVDCGERADEWSYVGDSVYDQSEWVKDRRGGMQEYHFSGNPKDYEPRCKPDHLRYDLARSRNAR